MKLIDIAIHKPVSVTVGILITALWSVLALNRLAIQILPTIDRPVISVQTNYYGASPFEIESEITNPIEENLAAVEDVREMTSRSSDNSSNIVLEFDWGVNKDLAMIDIVKKLNQVSGLPRDADESIVSASNSAQQIPVMWIGVVSENKLPNDMRTLTEEHVQPRLERVPGVARVFVYGGQEREIRVILDHQAMNQLNLTVADVRRAIDDENQNVKGGYIDEGKTRYTVRTVGQYTDTRDLEAIVVKQVNGSYVRLRDIARIEDSFKRQNSEVRMNSRPVCAVPVYKKTEANTLDVVAGLDEAIVELNAELQYQDIQLLGIYRESDFIYESLREVRTNLIYGAILAALVLLLFLRNARSTLIVTVTIPISLLASFLVLYAMGRTLNIITLAGLSFAAGMVVDNAIVVIENIFRHRQEMGKNYFRAAFDGTKEVWGAMLASSLTTLSVFLPIIFIEEEAGQIFKDIAIAISAAIVFSLAVALTVIPMLSSRFLRIDPLVLRGSDGPGAGGSGGPAGASGSGGGDPAAGEGSEAAGSRKRRRMNPISALLSAFGGFVSRAYLVTIDIIFAARWRKVVFVVFALAVFGASLALSPPAEYLPSGNRNFIFGIMQTPPGFNLEQKRQLLSIVEGMFSQEERLDYYFTVALPGDSFLGTIVKKEHEDETPEILQNLQMQFFGIPGAQTFIAQMGFFSRGLGGKSVDITIMGRSFEELQNIAADIQGRVMASGSVRQVRSSFQLGNPELQVRVDREAAAAVGLTTREVADAVETLVAGRIASLYRDGGKEYDITLVAPLKEFQTTEDLSRIRIQTPSGRSVKISSVAEVHRETGPTRIDHTEQDRSITLNCFLNDDVTVGGYVETLENEILPEVQESLPAGYTLDLTGSASDLERTFAALSGGFILAVILVYLLMCALYESFIHPFVIMFSIPLAASGAFLGVRFSGTEFNVITMLGFIILAGIVVNNGILLVDRSLQIMRLEGRPAQESIRLAAQQRMRPIFMTTVTTILGILPLTLSRGAGAELYNGLGSAIVGGLLISSLFTLVLIPTLLSLLHELMDKVRGKAEDVPAAA